MLYKSYYFDFQKLHSGELMCHTMRVIWDGNPQKTGAKIIAGIHKTYKMTKSSHLRLTNLANCLVNRGLGLINFWPNFPHSWSYTLNLEHYSEANDQWIERFKDVYHNG